MGVTEAIKAGIIDYSSFLRKVEKVGLHGDAAFVMGGDTVKNLGNPEDGKTVEQQYNNVWAKKNGRWLMPAWQASIVSG